MARGAGCLNWARPDLWGAEVGNRPGLPDRGGLGSAYLFPALSSAGASLASPCPVSTPRSSNRTGPFKASGSRTRLDHPFAHGELSGPSLQAVQPQVFVQVALREPCLPGTADLVLGLQPSAKPVPHVVVHEPVGLLHRAQPKIVRPALQFPVDLGDLVVDLTRCPPPFRQLADRAAEPVDRLPRRASARCRPPPSAGCSNGRWCTPGSRTTPPAGGRAASWSRSPSASASTSSPASPPSLRPRCRGSRSRSHPHN